MVAKAYDERATSTQQKENYETHPVIRTLYDHLDEVTCLEFHPKEAILVSGSRDNTVKLFDYSKSSVKKAYKVLQVVTISFITHIFITNIFFKIFPYLISSYYSYLFSGCRTS